MLGRGLRGGRGGPGSSSASRGAAGPAAPRSPRPYRSRMRPLRGHSAGPAPAGDALAGLSPLARSPAADCERSLCAGDRAMHSFQANLSVCSPSPPFPVFLLTFHTTLPCLSLKQLLAVS